MCVLSKFCDGRCTCGRCAMTWNTESIAGVSTATSSLKYRLSRRWRQRRSSTKKRRDTHRPSDDLTSFPATEVPTPTDDEPSTTQDCESIDIEEGAPHAQQSTVETSQYFSRSSWYRQPLRGPRNTSTRLPKTKYPDPKFPDLRRQRTQAGKPERSDCAAGRAERELSARLPRSYSAKPDVAGSGRAEAATKDLRRASSAYSDVHSHKRYSIQLQHSAVVKGVPVIHSRASTQVTRRADHRYAPARRKRGARRPPRVRIRRRPRKVVVIGDMCSGKSGLISAYCKDRFNEMYIPTIIHSCLTDARVFGELIDLVVVEVAGRDDYARLRRCAYLKMDVVILCYSANNIDSLERVKNLWLPELKKHAPKVPYILVGTKKDAREEYVYQLEVLMEEDSKEIRRDNLLETIVTTHKGRETAKSIGAHGFVECSALYREGTREVFETAAKVALRKSRRKRKYQRQADPCVIL